MNAGIRPREMKDVVEQIEFLDPGSGAPRRASASELRFRYRALELPADTVLLQARFRTQPADREAVRERVRRLLEQRRQTQPVDQVSCGSVFKNPPHDHAGRLIEAAGLKGARVGEAEVSTLHANFILNRGGATATDVLRLVDRVRQEVLRRFGVELEPEVRILGEQP